MSEDTQIEETTVPAAEVSTDAVEPVLTDSPVDVNVNIVPPQGDSDDTPPPSEELVSDAEYFGFDEKQEARFAKEEDELADMGGKLYGGNLLDHLRYGKRAYNHIFMAKTAMDVKKSKLGHGSEFKDTDHDCLCGNIARKAERRNAIGRDGKKKSDVRVLDDIRAYKWTEYVTPLVGAEVLKTLAWSVVNTYLAPKSLAYNKKEMSGSIRVQWVDFVKEWVFAFADFGKEGTTYAGETDYRRYLTDAIQQHEAALKAERDGKKTAEQLASAAAAKKTQDAKRLKDKASTALCTSLSNALAGILTAQEVADCITTTVKGMNLEPLPITKSDAALMDVDQIIHMLGAVATDQDAQRFVKTLFDNNKFEALRLVSTYSARLAEVSIPELAVA